MTDKVGVIEKLRQEYRALKSRDQTEIYAGFSHRLNFLIDVSDLNIPSINSGRVTFLSEFIELSRPVVGEWITKNRPPKDAVLLDVVSLLLNHVEGGKAINPARVVSWLRYGDEVSPCPLQIGVSFHDPVERELLPLAAKIIATEAKAIGLDPKGYDLRKVLELTVSTLKDFELRELVDVEEIHLQIIREHFAQGDISSRTQR